VLARHYGFTNEELDFIVNYDIKYPMGGEAEGITTSEAWSFARSFSQEGG